MLSYKYWEARKLFTFKHVPPCKEIRDRWSPPEAFRKHHFKLQAGYSTCRSCMTACNITKNIELNAVISSHQQRSYYAKLFKLSCKPQMCELTNMCAHVDTVGGKCPTWTWPNYWGYNLQQILESDVQNPQKKTVTNLLRHAPNQPPTRSLRCMYFPLPTPLTTLHKDRSTYALLKGGGNWSRRYTDRHTRGGVNTGQVKLGPQVNPHLPHTGGLSQNGTKGKDQLVTNLQGMQ